MNQKNNANKIALRDIAQRYEQAMFNRSPEIAMYWGRLDAPLDKFMDRKLSAIEAWRKTEDNFLSELNVLSIQDLKDSPEYHTYQLLKQTLENEKAGRVCKDELWNVNPMLGWHNIAAMVAEKQPVGTNEYRELAIKRFSSLTEVVDDEINNLRVGLKEGYTAPKPVVQRVLKQLAILKNTPVESSPYFELAIRDGSPEFKRRMADVIENHINPAITRYAAFLENEYLPVARDKVGVMALPHGEQCYKAKVMKETTLSITAKAIFDYGQQHMEQIRREVAEIGQREFATQDMSEVFHLAKEKSTHYFQSEKDILDYNFAALERVKNKVPAWFDMLPKVEGIIKPYPLHRAQTGAPGEYHPPSDDGKRPGIFYINTYEPEKRSRIDQEATLFHELIPGHHFQIALVMEDKTQLSINKYLWNSGYGEGWALYTERLADEMGLYSDDISRLGMLSNEALRAARLVVDPGLHVMNWTRQQAVDYLKQHTAMDDNIIEAEVDRYIMLPGQATSYMLGKREIASLREKAKQQLGSKFDIRQYHNQVLKNGTVTLPMLRGQIEDWIERARFS
ncbi:MAG: DUF885 domain-containing protein [Proteobacteria bacterium]|nr:DUF885 domain-containing protein [Pseudomonadota bacterium]